MGQEPQPGERWNLKDGKEDRLGSSPSAPDLDKRYPVALALYGILALLVWFTMGEGKVLVLGRPVELRLVPLIILGGMALRTVLFRHAEKIRRSGDVSGSL